MAVKVKHHKGKWWVFIDHHNKRKAKCIGLSKRAAEIAAEKIQARLTLGQFGILEEQEKRPFSTCYTEWLNSYAKTHTKEATYANYETAYRVHLLPFFGHADIRDITRAQLKRFIYEKLNANLCSQHCQSNARTHFGYVQSGHRRWAPRAQPLLSYSSHDPQRKGRTATEGRFPHQRRDFLVTGHVPGKFLRVVSLRPLVSMHWSTHRRSSSIAMGRH